MGINEIKYQFILFEKNITIKISTTLLYLNNMKYGAYKGMNKKIINFFQQREGSAARMIDRMPKVVQKTAVRVLSYPYQYTNLDPFIQCVLAVQHKQGKVGIIHGDILQSRKQFEKQMQILCSKKTKVKRVEDIRLPLQSKTIFARHYHPEPHKKLPMVVYYHGGGFVLGSVDSYDEVCRLLAVHAQVQVLSIEYPLAPEASPSEIIQICEDALAWTYQNRKNLKIFKNRIAVAGDSAGGNLATVVAQQSKTKKYAPRAQLLIYPTTDFANRYPSYYAYKDGLILTASDVDIVIEQYAKKHHVALNDSSISPLYGNLRKLAPTLLITAQYDVLHDEGEIYAERLKQQGVKVKYINYEDQTHGFISFTPISKNAKKHTITMFKEFRKFWNKQEGYFWNIF
jgi:acetyl esterase